MNKDVLTKIHTWENLRILNVLFHMVENGNFLRLKSATTREDDKENENNGEYDDCIYIVL